MEIVASFFSFLLIGVASSWILVIFWSRSVIRIQNKAFEPRITVKCRKEYFLTKQSSDVVTFRREVVAVIIRHKSQIDTTEIFWTKLIFVASKFEHSPKLCWVDFEILIHSIWSYLVLQEWKRFGFRIWLDLQKVTAVYRGDEKKFYSAI